MAAAADESMDVSTQDQFLDENRLTCSYCNADFRKPRFFPGCKHTFCESCLQRYLSNLRSRDLIEDFISCPERGCRDRHYLPDHIDIAMTPNLVETFPLDTSIMELMAARSQEETDNGVMERTLCDPCAEKGERSIGSKYCLHCLEVLCDKCVGVHGKSQRSVYHKIVNFQDLSEEERNEKILAHLTKCVKHPDNEVQFYSKNSDRLLCAVCMANATKKHKDAVEISSQDIDAAQLTEEVSEITKQLKSASGHLKQLQKIRMDNKSKVNTQVTYMKDNINHMRESANKVFDKVVSYVTETADELKAVMDNRLDEDMARVFQIITLSDQKASHLQSIANHGTDKHKFIATHLIKEQLEKMELKMSEEDVHLVKLNIKMKLDDELTRLSDRRLDVKSVAEVRLIESESMIHSNYFLAMNQLTDKKLVKVEERTVKPQGRHPPKFVSISTDWNERLILCDTNNGLLCIYDPSNNGFMKSRLVNSPTKAVPLDGKYLAVCSAEERSICFVIQTESNELKIVKRYKMKSLPTTIASIHPNRLIIFQYGPPAVCILSINSSKWQVDKKAYFDQDSTGRRFKSLEYVAVDEKRGHIIHPCHIDRAVYCFDLITGKPVFKYSGVSLKEPRDAALDKCGNIYVCEHTYSIVHKLSPTGKVVCIITEGIPRNPLAICHDHTGTRFWITQDDEGQTVYLYEVA